MIYKMYDIKGLQFCRSSPFLPALFALPKESIRPNGNSCWISNWRVRWRRGPYFGPSAPGGSANSRWVLPVSRTNVDLRILQWQSRCFYFMTYVSARNTKLSYWGWITDDVMASSYSGSRGSTTFLLSLLFTWQLDYSRLTSRLSTSGYILYAFRLTWLTRLLQKRPSWKTSTLLYVFVRMSLVCTTSAAPDRLG